MRKVVALASILWVLGANSIWAQYEECCQTCSCALCGDLQECIDGPSLAANCTSYGPGSGCGTDLSDPCDEFYDNSQYVSGGYGQVDSYSSTSGTYPCIPIDGGLGFLIAGGIGMGVIGIRRRKEELELKRA